MRELMSDSWQLMADVSLCGKMKGVLCNIKWWGNSDVPVHLFALTWFCKLKWAMYMSVTFVLWIIQLFIYWSKSMQGSNRFHWHYFLYWYTWLQIKFCHSPYARQRPQRTQMLKSSFNDKWKRRSGYSSFDKVSVFLLILEYMSLVVWIENWYKGQKDRCSRPV